MEAKPASVPPRGYSRSNHSEAAQFLTWPLHALERLSLFLESAAPHLAVRCGEAVSARHVTPGETNGADTYHLRFQDKHRSGDNAFIDLVRQCIQDARGSNPSQRRCRNC
jgi:hypothetical protein